MNSATRGALVAIAALFGVSLAVLGLTRSLSGGSDPVQAPPTEVRIGEPASGTPGVVPLAPPAPPVAPVPVPAPAPLPPAPPNPPAPGLPPPVEVVPPPPVFDGDDDGDGDDGNGDDGDGDDDGGGDDGDG